MRSAHREHSIRDSVRPNSYRKFCAPIGDEGGVDFDAAFESKFVEEESGMGRMS